MVDNISYSTTLTRNAYAVISDIFAQAVVNIAFSFTDLKELLFIGGFLITVFFKIIIQGISIQKLRHPGNEILITLDTVFSKLLLFFYFITLRRSEEHTSELQSRLHLVCRLLLEKK